MMRIISKLHISILSFLLTFFVLAGNQKAYSSEHSAEPAAAAHQGDEKMNAGKLIMEHVMDQHGWHLWGHTELPLPVILYSEERGLDVFMSSDFHHGHSTYKGYRLHEGHIEVVNEEGEMDAHSATVNEELTAGLYDFSITKNVASMLLSMIIMVIVFINVASAYRRRGSGVAPTGFQNAIEPIIQFVKDDVIKPSIGEKKYERYVPYLLTVFFFIWINNLLGLIPIFPGGANVTGSISVALVLAVLTFLITSISANGAYWQHVFAMPGVPKGILLLLTPIEILGVFLRPFVLMIRLFANITAGHIIVLSFFCLIFIFAELGGPGLGFGVSPVTLVFTVFMTSLELLVAFLQAYVFTMLSAVYIGAAIEDHSHAEHH